VKEREGEGLISFVLSGFLDFGGFFTILSVDFICNRGVSKRSEHDFYR
jgi:hypothetical protein